MKNPILQSFSRYALEAIRPMRLEALRRLEKSQWWSPGEIQALQVQKLRRLLTHLSARVPYYRDVIAGVGFVPGDLCSPGDLRGLPVTTKNMIKENGGRLLAEKSDRKDLQPNATSGSTGVTLSFFSDRRISNYTNALGLRANRWTGWDIGDRQAVLWGAHSDDVSASLYGRIRNSLFHKRLYLSSYEMKKEKMIEYRYKINTFHPRLIEGYASALFLFARFLKDYQLRVHHPLGIISTAETLYPHQRKLIESVFHCPVFNRYGSREVSGIAQECEKHDGLHIFAEHVIVEVLDENSQPCRPGEVGKIVVTDLDNYVFPFLRYDIGDLGVATERACSCGRGLPLLSKVEGRVWDVIIGTNGNRLVGTFWLVSGIKGIRQFQVVQERVGELRLLIVGDRAFSELEKQKILRRIAANCGTDTKVAIHLVDEIPPTESGKHRYVISRVSPFL